VRAHARSPRLAGDDDDRRRDLPADGAPSRLLEEGRRRPLARRKPAGWDGPIEYTVWFGAMVNGRCHLAASINWWHGERDENSGPVLTAGHYPANLWYLDSTLGQHAPAAGEPIFVMVSAGAARGS
jgi:hypothetical protein